MKGRKRPYEDPLHDSTQSDSGSTEKAKTTNTGTPVVSDVEARHNSVSPAQPILSNATLSHTLPTGADLKHMPIHRELVTGSLRVQLNGIPVGVRLS